MVIKAKRRIGDSRVYVGIDVCKELIKMDAISNVKAYKLKRGNGGPSETVYLIIGAQQDCTRDDVGYRQGADAGVGRDLWA